jgi:hypothetical protein
MTCWVTTTWGIEVEGEKRAVWNERFFIIEKRTGCSTLCGTQGACAGLFDILLLPRGDCAVGSARHAAKLV